MTSASADEHERRARRRSESPTPAAASAEPARARRRASRGGRRSRPAVGPAAPITQTRNTSPVSDGESENGGALEPEVDVGERAHEREEQRAAGERRRDQRRVAQHAPGLARARAAWCGARPSGSGGSPRRISSVEASGSSASSAERDAPARRRGEQRDADAADEPAGHERGDVVAHRARAERRRVRLGHVRHADRDQPRHAQPLERAQRQQHPEARRERDEQRRHHDRAAASTSEARRPIRSDSGPQNQAPTASAPITTEMLSPACDGDTSNSRPSSGRIACVEYMTANIAAAATRNGAIAPRRCASRDGGERRAAAGRHGAARARRPARRRAPPSASSPGVGERARGRGAERDPGDERGQRPRVGLGLARPPARPPRRARCASRSAARSARRPARRAAPSSPASWRGRAAGSSAAAAAATRRCTLASDPRRGRAP